MTTPPSRAARFRLDLGDGDALVLREAWTVEPMHALTQKNLERLRPWELWAQGEQTRDGLAAFTTSQLHAWVDGTALPAVILHGDEIVGSIGARISPTPEPPNSVTGSTLQPKDADSSPAPRRGSWNTSNCSTRSDASRSGPQ